VGHEKGKESTFPQLCRGKKNRPTTSGEGGTEGKEISRARLRGGRNRARGPDMRKKRRGTPALSPPLKQIRWRRILKEKEGKGGHAVRLQSTKPGKHGPYLRRAGQERGKSACLVGGRGGGPRPPRSIKNRSEEKNCRNLSLFQKEKRGQRPGPLLDGGGGKKKKKKGGGRRKRTPAVGRLQGRRNSIPALTGEKKKKRGGEWRCRVTFPSGLT